MPTVSDVLALDVVRRGAPTVVAGERGLDARVRWVHVSELPDIAYLLRGGELVLTTGIALPDGDTELRRYVADLAGVGAAGVVIELGRRYHHELPRPLTHEAERHDLPLVTLARETRFVRVTEAVHEQIIDTQLDELRRTERVHEAFTALSVEGTEPAQVVREAARMSGRPTVLENLSHQVLAVDAAGFEPAELLAEWEATSRRVATQGRTGYDPSTGWLVTTVGARSQDWGRLVLVCDDVGDGRIPPHWLWMLTEKAATTLALVRLLERDRETLELQAHRNLLADLTRHADVAPDEIAARAQALGVPLRGRRLLGLVLRPGEDRGDGDTGMASEVALRELAEVASRAARSADLAALVGVAGAAGDRAVGMVLALGRGAQPEPALDAFTGALQGRPRAGTLVAAGSAVDELGEVSRSLAEARHVAAAAAHLDGTKAYYRLPDLRLRGLMYVLRDDPRLQTFTERELGPLLAQPATTRTELLGALVAFLDHAGNKVAAARSLHLSRPALYSRLAKLQSLLGVDLDDADSRASLRVALLARDAITQADG